MYDLICHPDTPSSCVSQVTAQLTAGHDLGFWVEFMITPTDGVILPEFKPRKGRRTSELWQKTCFEVFLKPTSDASYVEFNLSPSFDWAAYSFASHRSGMKDYAVRFEPEIEITPSPDSQFYWLASHLPMPNVQSSQVQLGLTAVIEETGGHKSYWALAHPPGAPDFHDPSCFIARLPE